MTKFSIITPTHNVEKYIKQTIKSVLEQTYKDFEWIIIDGSSDKTRSIIETFDDPRIKLIKAKDKSSAAINRNLGIKAASGEFIATLDGDDYWQSDYLENQLKILSENQLLTTNAYLVIGEKISEETFRQRDPFPKNLNKENYFIELLKINFIFTMTIIPKKVYDKCGLFDEELDCCEDYEMWLRLAKNGYRFFPSDKPEAYYRIRKGSLSESFERNQKALIKIFKKLEQKYQLNNYERKIIRIKIKKIENDYNKYLVKKNIIDNEIMKARQKAIKVFKNNPSEPKYFFIWLFLLLGQKNYLKRKLMR